MLQSFLGFHRPDGKVGIRNHVLILSTSGLSNPLVRRLALCVRGTIPIYTPNGRGQVGQDFEQLERTLTGLAGNPNVASTLVVGYDEKTTQHYKHQIEKYKKRVETLSIFKERGVIRATEKGLRLLTEMVVEASVIERKKAPLSALTLALECGGSDPSSGKVSNPTVGDVSDFVIQLGGSAIFSETVELIGTEKILSNRAVNEHVAKDIQETIHGVFKDACERGVEVKSVNPVPENIEGGLDTLEEKALGALMKTGKSKISGVLDYAVKPSGPGLYFMNTPFFSSESMTAMAAAGAQVVLFTTGVGNNIACPLSPTIKITGNPDTSKLMSEHVDVDVSRNAVPDEDPKKRRDLLLTELIRVCNGKLTHAEVLDETDTAISRIGPSV